MKNIAATTPTPTESFIIVEALEDRIAPAAMFTYTDVDGDTVLIKTSKGTDTQLANAVAGHLVNGQLYDLDLTTAGTAFAKSSVSIAVTARSGSGDGLVNVGLIDATNIDLAAVTVKGDLSKLLAGDTNYKTAGVASVTAQSVGTLGITTQGNMGDLQWQITGGTKAVKIAGDVDTARLFWFGDTSVTVGSISIGGSLTGGGASDTGEILLVRTTGVATLGSLTIGGSLNGSGHDFTGDVRADNIGHVLIGGSLNGTGNNDTGSIIAAGSLGDVLVGGSLNGGAGDNSGEIQSGGTMGAVTVHGDFNGNAGFQSGSVIAGLGLKSAHVDGTLFGGNGSQAGTILAGGSIGDVYVGGSVFGGSGNTSGAIVESGANLSIGNVHIGGYLSGANGAASGTVETGSNGKIGDVYIGAGIEAGSGSGSGIVETGTLGNVVVIGDVIGGTKIETGMIHATVGMASVSVSGSLIGGDGELSGVILLDNASGTAKVAFITVEGNLQGGATDSFSGMINVAGTIGKLTVGGSLKGGDAFFSGSIASTFDGSTFNPLSIGTLTIGGSTTNGNFQAGALTGGNGMDSGSVFVTNVGTALLTQSIDGGAGNNSGTFFVSGNSTTITIEGGVVGGGGQGSGNLNIGTNGTLNVGIGLFGGSVVGGGFQAGDISGNSSKIVNIAGSVFGGGQMFSGLVDIPTVGNMTISGGVFGNFANATDNSGEVLGQVLTGKLTINGGLHGANDSSNSGIVSYGGSANVIQINGNIDSGDTSMSNVTFNSGIYVTGTAKSIIVNGNITAGDVQDATDINFAAIRAGALGSLLISGNVTGNEANAIPSHILITGQGNTLATKGANLAIGSVTINGSVTYTDILGGYNTTGSTHNGVGGTNGGSAQIGTVLIKGPWENSTIATGASDNGGSWGDGTNTHLGVPAGSTIVASIAKVTFNGPASATTFNGVVAQKITSLVLAGFNVPVVAPAQFQLGPDFHFQVETV